MRLPLYTGYSPSHAQLFELMSGTAGAFDLRPVQLRQECATGTYKESGWEQAMATKVSVIVAACQRHESGELFAYTDVDVVFNQQVDAAELFTAQLGGLDMAAQYDGSAGFCAGLFVCRGSPAMTKAWQLVASRHREWASLCDQTVLNYCYAAGQWSRPIGLLSCATSLGAFKGFQRAVTAQDLVEAKLKPKDLTQWAAFHASWVIGVDEKHAALRYVRDLL